MIKVFIPGNFIPERSYIVETLLADFLGLDISIQHHSLPDYRLTLENGREIVVRDHFFSRLDGIQEPDYLEAGNIPGAISWIDNPLALQTPLPVIFGDAEWTRENGRLICGIDMFASAFFMLSRWEEVALREKKEVFDSHGRFPATSSLAFQQGFIDRPVVNEYVELLWNILHSLGVNQERKPRNFSFVLTHDVDALVLWRGWGHVTRTAVADIVKRFSLPSAVRRLHQFWDITRGAQKDPYDSYQLLMDISESLNLTSHFYFKCGGNRPQDRVHPFDIRSPKARQVIRSIRSRDHIVGFHPSYQASTDAAVWNQELTALSEVCECAVTEGRQHYLKFQVPFTWRLWEENGMNIDSTLGFADREGFRCGTGDEYRVFDVAERRTLRLKERPLVFMEHRNHFCGGFQGAVEEHEMASIVAAARRMNTPVTLLFHNDAMSEPLFQQMYRRILSL